MNICATLVVRKMTTKVSHEYLRADDFARSVEQSLRNLDVDFVDLLESTVG